MLLVLALDSLDAPNKKGIASRDKALAWLKKTPPNGSHPAVSSEWYALRLLIETKFGEARHAEGLRDKILSAQHSDGGWGWLWADKKGRNLTARQRVGSMRANQLDDEAAAADYRLPVEVVREAVAYVEKNRQLLETEAEIERLMLQRGGNARGPQVVKAIHNLEEAVQHGGPPIAGEFHVLNDWRY